MQQTSMAIRTIDDLEALRESLLAKRKLVDVTITVCTGTACTAKGSGEVIDALRREVEKYLDRKVPHIQAKCTGCHGFCEQGPIVVVMPYNVFYTNVKAEDAAEIVTAALTGHVVERLLYVDPVTGSRAERAEEIPFYTRQKRVVLSHNGALDPTDILDYIAEGGYRALWKALREMTSEEIIAEIERSGLRGRGGGGYPTGRKWRSCREAHGEKKYVICNGDEGDPGAFMDRSILEGDPHSVIEGMIIGAYAIGAHEGFIYLRNEYPLAVERFQEAVAQAEEYGFLGEDVYRSGFDFTIAINRGGGAFVCGESTALTASLEGRPGEPRMKYIHTTESGLWGMPTNLNNVETWANVPRIIEKGADWFASMGTEGSKGTKVFSLVGKVKNTGLVEVPMGMTLREIIYDIGGGIQEDKAFKAVQTGGPSGGCIPLAHLDTPVDFDELTKLGSMMGSGGMIVMDEETCMVDVARYFTRFLVEESCGKCVPCREGLPQVLAILDRIADGKGEGGDVEKLEHLCDLLESASLCALGSTAGNPVRTTLRYFKDEYVEHIEEKHCAAGVCRALFQYEIGAELCTGCGACRKKCPQEAISGEKKKAHDIDQDNCVKCGFCFDACKFDAIRKV